MTYTKSISQAVSELTVLINKCKGIKRSDKDLNHTLHSSLLSEEIDSFNHFQEALERTVSLLRAVEPTLKKIDEGTPEDFRIQIKTGTKRHLVDYRSIQYVQGLKDYTTVYTAERKYLVKGCVKVIERYLPKDHFMGIHKSFIVSKVKICGIHRNHVDLGFAKLPVGKHFRGRIESYFSSKVAETNQSIVN